MVANDLLQGLHMYGLRVCEWAEQCNLRAMIVVKTAPHVRQRLATGMLLGMGSGQAMESVGDSSSFVVYHASIA